ncbi:MAG: tripartite tricarboxylate transporter permease [Candidatus Nanoarchaeia archaeon]
MPFLPVDLLLALGLGCCAGIFTGLAPGIHTNTVAAGILTVLPILTQWFSPLALGVFLTSMVIMHSFTDFIPSIFIGAPDDGETALSVLPGHKMLLEGKGYDALKLTVVGGIGATIIGLMILPIFGFVIMKGYDNLGIIIPILILAFSAFFILIEPSLEGKIWATVIFALSGVLGILALNLLPIKEPLFPLLTGLFGIPTLIISMRGHNKIIEQQISDKIVFSRNWLNHAKASICAAIMSILPALGAAQATVLAQAISKKGKSEENGGSKNFLIIVGGINTVSSIFVLTTLFLIGRARTGVLAAMKQFLSLDIYSFMVLLIASLIAIGFSAVTTLELGKFFAKNIIKFKYRKMSLFVLIILVILIILFSGLMGLLTASVAVALGLIAPKVGIKRIHAMGALAVPIVTFFI